MEFKSCPVCSCGSYSKSNFSKSNPYVMCSKCLLHFQLTPSSKVYEASHEKLGSLMSSEEKHINRRLAKYLYTHHLHGKFKVSPEQPKLLHLDIGSKYPYLGSCFNDLGIESTAIDGIPEVVKFGKELGVESYQLDIEEDDIPYKKYNLITLIHCLEHFYKPLSTLSKIRGLLHDGATLFIRCPDSEVAGIERDLTPGHYDIHPLIWNQTSVAQALVELRDKFVIYKTYELQPGQRDYYLRAITVKPSIWAGYIVKNEERDLPDSLKSIKSLVDGVHLVDTGSTDGTKDIFHESGLPCISYEEYTGASEQDDKGEWQLWDFSKARNRFVKEIEDKAQYCLWMDADDRLTEGSFNDIRRSIYLPYDIYSFRVKTGHSSFHTHHRLWKTGHGVKFHGAIHEYPGWPRYFNCLEYSSNIIHYTQGSESGSVLRNYRILEREIKKDKSPRNVFYLANTCRDRYGINLEVKYLEEAITWYDYYIFNFPANIVELSHAYWYKARCLRFLRNYLGAITVCEQGLMIDSSYAEFHCEMSFCYANLGEFKNAIECAEKALALPFIPRLFSEKSMYTDQPYRQLAHNYKRLEDFEKALDYAEKAMEHIPKTDSSWISFIEDLKIKVGNPISSSTVYNICRPGAIGDVIITSSVVKGLKDLDPTCSINYYTKIPDAARLIEGVFTIHDSDYWNTRPKGKDLVLTGYPVNSGYPNTAMTKPLYKYFCEEAGVSENLPSLKRAVSSVLSGKKFVTIHPCAGWSKYKNWHLSNWDDVINMLKADPRFSDYLFVQIGGKGDQELKNLDMSFVGCSLEQSVWLIQNSQFHLGVDSFSNHVAGACGKPAVILFGSTSPIGSGYKSSINIWRGLFCSPCYRENPDISSNPKSPCPNSHDCMLGISVKEVFSQILVLTS